MTETTRHPLIALGIRDSRIRNHLAFQVLVYLVEVLGDAERCVYQQAVSNSLAMHRDTVRRALYSLEKRGYIRKHGDADRGAAVYSLVLPSELHHRTPRPDMPTTSARSTDEALPALDPAA
jgi:DNA-binding transcriptional MocR family regulator